MKPADDPLVDYKALIQRGYDRCASAYAETRTDEASPELELLSKHLDDGASSARHRLRRRGSHNAIAGCRDSQLRGWTLRTR